MSEHVADRLSAFLDRELTEGEAAAVRQHLGECERCATRLGELQGVDRAFAGSLPEAPAGYFDSFAARVRARLEERPTVAPKDGFRLPAWSWAVAAALLLGLLLPRVPWDAALPLPEAAPAPLPRPSLAPAPAEAGAPMVLEERVTPRSPAQAASARPDDALRPSAAPPPAAKPAASATTGFASRPATEPAGPREALAPPASAPPGALRKELESDLPAAATSEALVLADAELRSGDESGAKALAAREEASAAKAPEEATKVEGARSARSVPAVAAPGRAAAGALAEDRGDPANRRPALPEEATADARESAAGRRGEDAARSEFEALSARRARTAEELRGLRAAWRSFLTRHPSDPVADEARVLVVVASVELSARTGAAGDRAEARREAEAYLRRADAAQKERVSALLRRLDP